MSEFHLPDSLANLFGKKKPTETSAEPVVENQLQVTTSQGEEKKFDVIYEKGAEPVSADSLKNLTKPAEVTVLPPPERDEVSVESKDEELVIAQIQAFKEGTIDEMPYHPLDRAVEQATADVSAIKEPQKPADTAPRAAKSVPPELTTKYQENAEREGWSQEEFERIKQDIALLRELRKKVDDAYLTQQDRALISQKWEYYKQFKESGTAIGLAQFELKFTWKRVSALHEYAENESNWNWRWAGKDAVSVTEESEKARIKQARIDRLQDVLRQALQPFPQDQWYTVQEELTGEASFANADSNLTTSRKVLKKLLRERMGVVDEAKIAEIAQRFFDRKNNKFREGIAPRDDIQPSDGITPDLAIPPEPDDDIWTLPANPDSGTLPTSEDQEETHAILLDLARKLRDRKAVEEQQRVATEPETPQPDQPVPADTEASPTPSTDTTSSPDTPPTPEIPSKIPKKNLTEVACDPVVSKNHDGRAILIFNKHHNILIVFELSALKNGLSQAIKEGENWRYRYTGRLDDYEARITSEQKAQLEAAISSFESSQDNQGLGDNLATDSPEAAPMERESVARLVVIDSLLKSSEFKGLFTNTAEDIFKGELLALLTEVNADNAQDKRIQLLDALYHHPTVGTEFKNILHSKMRVIQLNAFMDRVYGSESGKDAVINWNADGSQNVYRKNEEKFDAEWAKVPQLNRAQRLFARMRNVFTNQGVPRAGETTFEESVVGRQVNPSAPEANPDRNKKINRKRAIAAAVVVAALATLSSVTVANKGENDAEKGVTANPATAVLDAEQMQAAAGKDVDNLTPQEEAIADRLSDDQTDELVPVANSAGKWEVTRLSNGDISLISNDSGESVTVHVPQAEESEVQSGFGAIKIGAEPTQAQDRVIDADKIATEVVQDVIDQTKQEQVRANVSEASAETPTMFSTSIWNKLATELPLIKALKNDVVFGAVFQSDLTVEQRNDGNIAGGQLIDVLKDVNNAFLLLSNRDVDLSSVGKGSKLILLTGVTDIKDIITLREKYPDADGAILDKTQNTNLAIYTRLVLQKAARIQAGEAIELTDFEKWVVERLNGHPDFGGPGWIPDPDKRTVAHAEDLVQPSEQANLQRLLDIANGKYLY